MTTEKFEVELNSLDKFFSIHCKDKHQEQKIHTFYVNYKDKSYTKEINLCDECKELIDYSIKRLQECPHEEKPRCRKCPSPCYEKTQWKKVAKLMRYSGIKLGVSKLKKRFGF